MLTINSLIIVHLLAVGPVSRTADKLKLPEGMPPRIVTVIEVKPGVVIYRDLQYMLPATMSAKEPLPARRNDQRTNELFPAFPLAGPKVALGVEFSLKDGKVIDAEGNKVGMEEVLKRLKPGDTVLVTSEGDRVDPAYTRIMKKETLILLHVKPATRSSGDPPPFPQLPRPEKPDGH